MSALSDIFTDIANAIRARKGVSTRFTPAQMASAINGITMPSNKVYYLSGILDDSWGNANYYVYWFFNEVQKEKLVQMLSSGSTTRFAIMLIVYLPVETEDDNFFYETDHRTSVYRSSSTSLEIREPVISSGGRVYFNPRTLPSFVLS